MVGWGQYEGAEMSQGRLRVVGGVSKREQIHVKVDRGWLGGVSMREQTSQG